jgi:hypothetical protein
MWGEGNHRKSCPLIISLYHCQHAPRKYTQSPAHLVGYVCKMDRRVGQSRELADMPKLRLNNFS